MSTKSSPTPQPVHIPGFEAPCDDDGSYTMCRRPPNCCPKVKFLDDGGAVFTDEGQTITFDYEQLAVLAAGLDLHFVAKRVRDLTA